MAETVAARGSLLTAEDFANHRGDTVAPISTNYRGVDLLEIPPNGQGLTAVFVFVGLIHWREPIPAPEACIWTRYTTGLPKRTCPKIKSTVP
ncbi:hypothetical protein AJ88_37725 [Mesorhizobium amorphae CCBAU 01583]|nr:hypothetical protein AJ88_37725 [Mesorhizobium amorphae CCBAU 01583]